MHVLTDAARMRGFVVAALLLAGVGVHLPARAQQCPPEARIQSIAQSVDEGVAVTPNGNSSKPNNATYLWERVSGPGPITFTPSATAASVSFIAPQVTGDQQLVIRLTVRGCSPLQTHSTEATVTIRDTTTPPANTAPTAVPVATPSMANEQATVTLSGTGSTDPQNNITQYLWTQVSGPSVTLATPNAATTTFVTPSVPTPAGANLVFKLKVTDAGGLFHEANVTVNVLFANDAPHAALSCPEVVLEGQDLVLAGSGSTDYEDDLSGTPLTYRWSQLLGPPNFDIGDLTTSSVTVVPHLGTGDEGLVNFELQVTDSGGLQSVATCSVFIEDATAPVFGNDGDRIEEATGPDGANVAYNLTAIDNVEGDVSGAIACLPPSGSAFELDVETPVECAVADANGNGAETEFFVTVKDRTKPVIGDHEDIAVQADGPGGTVVAYDLPGITEVVDVALLPACSPPSGHEFPLGSTDVTCTATDASGNAAIPTSFAVSVYDTLPPVVTVPTSDVVVEALSASGAVATFTATASDLVDGAVTPTCAPPSGSLFALGDTTVTCSATDAHHNTGSASFTVKVVDTTAPVLTLPPDATVEATSSSGAAHDFVATALDAVTGAESVTCTPPSGSTFPLGETTVECSASDDYGNTANGSFKVTVVDTQPPVITLEPPVATEATGPSGASVSWTATAEDIVDGAVDVTCDPAPGSTFALGATPVACKASDAHGNEATESFSVTVVDTTAPSLTMPADVTKEATSPAGATATFVPTATDLVDADVAIACSPASGSTFPLGDTTVHCTATDDYGNSASGTLDVKVRDTTDPNLHLPANIVAEATSPAGASVPFTVTADDIADPSVAIACTPASGSTFALGTATVHCTATDDSGNDASGSFTVQVRDTTDPIIGTPADIVVTTTSGSQKVVTYTNPGATDLVDTDVAVACVPPSGSTFLAGDTTVTCTATDDSGNDATSTFKVSVRYVFSGFFSPVDNLPIVNTVTAGQAIPVKFSLGGYQGMAIFAAGYPRSTVMPCGGSAQDAVEETTTAGSSTLQYDAGTGRYHYVWKTEKAWSSTCRQLQLRFADGTTQVANFYFRK